VPAGPQPAGVLRHATDSGWVSARIAPVDEPDLLGWLGSAKPGVGPPRSDGRRGR
jgi:hypothetical protein